MGAVEIIIVGANLDIFGQEIVRCQARRAVPITAITPIRVRAGMKKLPPRRIPTVGIVRKVVLSTRTQLTHKHHHRGGAVCPSYGSVSLDTPDRTRATSSEGVG